ncbi:MAG: hypothetical protein ACOH5I_26110 [Oligoflexus sp.]
MTISRYIFIISTTLLLGIATNAYSNEIFNQRADGVHAIVKLKETYLNNLRKTPNSNTWGKLQATSKYLKTLIFEAEYYHNPYIETGRRHRYGLYRECWDLANTHLSPNIVGEETEEYYYFSVYCGAQVVHLSTSTVEIYDVAGKIPKLSLSHLSSYNSTPDWGFYEGGGVWRGYALLYSAPALRPLPGGQYNPKLALDLIKFAINMPNGFVSDSGVDGFLTCENYLTQAQILFEHYNSESTAIDRLIDNTISDFGEYLFIGEPYKRQPETVRCIARLQEIKGQIKIAEKQQQIEKRLAEYKINGLGYMGFGTLWLLTEAMSKVEKDYKKDGERECEGSQALCQDMLSLVDVLNLLEKSRELLCKWQYESCLEELDKESDIFDKMLDRTIRDRFEKEMKKIKKKQDQEKKKENDNTSKSNGGGGYSGGDPNAGIGSSGGGGTEWGITETCKEYKGEVCINGDCYPQVQTICEYS